VQVCVFEILPMVLIRLYFTASDASLILIETRWLTNGLEQCDDD
jgi:hypothetical protein